MKPGLKIAASQDPPSHCTVNIHRASDSQPQCKAGRLTYCSPATLPLPLLFLLLFLPFLILGPLFCLRKMGAIGAKSFERLLIQTNRTLSVHVNITRKCPQTYLGWVVAHVFYVLRFFSLLCTSKIWLLVFRLAGMPHQPASRSCTMKAICEGFTVK